jgi:hypothetical protein
MCPPPTVKLEARIKPRSGRCRERLGQLGIRAWHAVQLPTFLQINKLPQLTQLQSCHGGQLRFIF